MDEPKYKAALVFQIQQYKKGGYTMYPPTLVRTPQEEKPT